MDVASLKVFITVELLPEVWENISLRWSGERLEYFWIFLFFIRKNKSNWGDSSVLFLFCFFVFWKIKSNLSHFEEFLRFDSLAFWEILAWGARTFLHFFFLSLSLSPPQNSILSTLRNSFSNERAENFAWNFPILFPSFFFKRGTFQFREAILRVEE